MSRLLFMMVMFYGFWCFSDIATAETLRQGPGSPQAGSSSGSQELSTIYGVVRSAKDKTPLEHVPVVILNTLTGMTLHTESNAQGGYLFTFLPAGSYEIRVGGGNVSLQRKQGFLKSGMVGRIDFDVRLLTAGHSRLSGTIYEAKKDVRSPIQTGIKVKNLRTGEIYDVRSKPDGTYSFRNIPSGVYLLQVDKEGFVPVSRKILVAGNTRQDIPLEINRLARAEIRAEANRKIRDTTGAISVIDQKKFQQNLTTGVEYTLEQNSPGIEFYDRDGSQGISADMYYMSCRGYNVAGNNATPAELSSGIEFSVDGIPLNMEANGGEIQGTAVMNADIKSATIQRGVTTSRQLGNYAAGCAIDLETVEPTKDAYQRVDAGGGSYGLYYTSYVMNTGINKNTNVGGYSDFTMLRQDGYREFTNFNEYNYYGNISKYLNHGKVYLIALADYQDYDRGASLSLANYEAYGPTDNGGPSLRNPANPGNTPNSPFYHNLDYVRAIVDLGVKEQITPSVRFKNSLYAFMLPYGNSSAPAGFGSCNGVTCTQNQFDSSSSYQTVNANYSGQLGYQFTENYYKSLGYKAGDQAEVRLTPWKGDSLYLGMKGQYFTGKYLADPLYSVTFIGSPQNVDAVYSQTTIGAYLENNYQPVKQILLSTGFRVMAISQYYNDLASPDLQTLYAANGYLSAVGVSNGGAFVIPLPHIGLNVYPADLWKIYINGGESYAEPVMFDYKGFASGMEPGNIAPETVWDLGIGTRYGTDEDFFALDLFSDYLANMPIPTFASDGLASTYEQVGTGRKQGIEADGRVELGYGFSGSGNFTYIWGVLGNTPVTLPSGITVNFQGDMVPFVPLCMGNLAVSYDHGPYHITIDERYTGIMNVIDFSAGPTGTENPQVMVPGYFTTDLYATYDLPVAKGWYKSASLYAEAYNLFNTNYYNPAGLEPAGPNGTVETLFVYPGEPVNMFAGIKVTF